MINPYIIIGFMVLLAGTATGAYLAGVDATNNKRDAALLQVEIERDAVELERGQEAADIIQEVLDEQDELERENRALVDRARQIERNNATKLDADRLQLWKETIAGINDSEATGTDAAPATTAPNQ